MGTAQATFEEVMRGGATGSDVTGSGPDRKWPEVTSPALIGSHGSDRVRMRNWFRPFFLTRVVVQNVVQVPWLPDVTSKGFTWVRTCATGSWGFPSFFWSFSPEVGVSRVVQNVGWGCSLRRLCLPVSLVICLFPAILIPRGAPSIEGHSAFIQD